MAHDGEWELKFELEGSHNLDGSAGWLPTGIREAPPRRLQTIYYDTPGGKLRKRNTVLRVRKSDGEFLQTIKQDHAGSFMRGEWEQVIGGPEPVRAAARGTPIEHFMAKRRQRDKLVPQFQVDVERRSYDVVTADTVIETSLDEGHVEADGHRLPIHELEFELKRGDPSKLFETARDVVGRGPLRLSFISKGERGYRLRDKSLAQPIPASAVRLSRRTTAKAALQEICRVCLHDLTSNVGTIDGEHAVEGVHKTRIAVRRLRAAMSLFKKIAVDEETQRLHIELKWLSKLLGDARDLDVLATERALPHAQDMSDAGTADRVAAKRKHARESLSQAVRSQRFYVFLVDLVRWIEDGAWLKQDSQRGDTRVVRFATSVITRRWKRLVNAATHVSKLSPDARHQLRITGKKLRYMTEFMESLAKGKKQRRIYARFLKQLERLQTSLGTLHDDEAREAFFQDIPDSPQAPKSAQAESTPPSFSEPSTEQAKLLRQAQSAQRKLTKIRPERIFA